MSIGGVVIYFQQDISLGWNNESWNPRSSFGSLGKRHKSRKAVITGTPVGMLSAALLDYFYAAFKTPSLVKSSIMSGAVVIASVAENKTYNFVRGGLSKPPPLVLKPTATAFGPMEVTCLSSITAQPTTATFWKAAEGTPSADTSFDETKIISDIYSMALGARSTPYNAIGGMEGFEVGFSFELAEIANGDFGIADIILAGVSTELRFAPSNLTEAQEDTLLALADTTAVLPGQAYAKANEDAVITGTQSGAAFTIKVMGAERSDRVYQLGEHRFKGLVMANNRKWTSGAAQPLFSYTGVS